MYFFTEKYCVNLKLGNEKAVNAVKIEATYKYLLSTKMIMIVYNN
jgi:hypothetical protein